MENKKSKKGQRSRVKKRDSSRKNASENRSKNKLKTQRRQKTSLRDGSLAILFTGIFFIVLILFYLLQGPITGLLVEQDLIYYNQSVGQLFDSNATQTITLEQHPTAFNLRVLQMDGTIVGDGDVRVYAKTGNETYLVLDSKSLEPELSVLTGLLVDGADIPSESDSSTTESESDSGSDSSTDSSSDTGGESDSGDSTESSSTEENSEKPSTPDETSESEPSSPTPGELLEEIVAETQPVVETPESEEGQPEEAKGTTEKQNETVEPEPIQDVNQTIEEQNETAELEPIQDVNQTIEKTNQTTEELNETITVPTENVTIEKLIIKNKTLVINQTTPINETIGTEHLFTQVCLETCFFSDIIQTNEVTFIIETNGETTFFISQLRYAMENLSADAQNVSFEKIKNDDDYELIIDSANISKGLLTVHFHHDDEDIQPISIIRSEGLDYVLSKNSSIGGEEVTLAVNNWNATKDYFEIKVGNQSEIIGFGKVPEFEFTGDVKDSKGQNVDARVSFDDFETKSEKYASTGETHNITVKRGVYDVRVQFTNYSVEEIVVGNVELDTNVTEFINVDDVNETGELAIYDQVYAIDPTGFNFTNATVTVTATGTELYKCKDWNFTTQICFGNWSLFKSDLVPGQEYSFVLTPEDPGFGEIINITKAQHLDVNHTLISDIFTEVIALDNIWSEPIYHNEYVRITFEKNLTSKKDITLYARNNQSLNTYVEVYHFNSSTKITQFPIITTQQYYKELLTGMNGSHDTFDLKIVNEQNDNTAYLEFDHIIDPTNNLPNVTNVVVNATSSNNLITDNLTVTFTVADADNDTVRNITNWIREDKSIYQLLMPFEANTTPADYSGYGNNGTPTGASYNITGGYDGGGAVEFDGTNDDVTISSPTFSDITTHDFTVMLRARLTSTAGTYTALAQRNGAGTGRSWMIFDSDDGSSYEFQTFLGGAPLVAQDPSNGWNHVTLRYNGSALALFVDGVEKNSSVRSVNEGATGDLVIGASKGYIQDYLGALDDLLIFNHSLSDEQIKAIYNNRTDLIVSQETSNLEIWQACITPTDSVDAGNEVCSNNLTVFNSLPATVSNVVLTSTSGNNLTTDNLTVAYSVSDPENDSVKNITRWLVDDSSIVVLHMPFDTKVKPTTDYSGYGNIGSSFGGDTFYNATGGYDGRGALQVGGTNDRIVISDPSFATITHDNNFTAMAWGKAFSFNVNGNALLGQGNGSAQGIGRNWLQFYANINCNGAPATNLGEDGLCGTTVVSLNTWYHLTVRYNGTTLAIFVNGIEENSSVRSINESATGDIFIGTNRALLQDFDGNIDEVLVFNRSLSNEQIKLIYENETDILVSQETVTGEAWQVCITPHDGTNDGSEVCSNELTILAAAGGGAFPTWSNLADNGTTDTPKVGENVFMNVSLADDAGLSSYTFSWNDSGSWVNDSAVGISGTNYEVNVTKTVTASKGAGVAYRFYFNDTDNNQNQTDIGTFTVRDTAPTTPTLSAPTNNSITSDSTPFFNWIASTDSDGDTITYEIQIDNDSTFTNPVIQENSSLTTINYTATTLSDDTYYWQVKAITADANSSYTETRILIVDTTLPALEFVLPTLANGTYVSNNYIEANVTSSDSNLANISIELFNGTGLLNSVLAASSPTYTNFSGLIDGTYYINATANDTATNANTTETRTIILDTTIPTVTLNSPANNSMETSSSIVTFNVTSSDTNLANVTLYIDGAVNQTNTSQINGDYIFSVTFVAGTHNWSILAFDLAGNSNQSETRILTVDTNAPTHSTITESPSDPATYSSGAQYEFNVTWTDNLAVDTVLIDFDGTNYTSISNVSSIYNISFLDLAAGTYNYRWYANDSSGNANDTGIQTYTIIQANDTVQLYLNNTQNNLTVTYGTQTNASAYSTTGTHTLHRDGIAITNPQIATLAAGTYVYKANSTGNTNYTSNTTGETYTLTINQATSEVNLTLDGISANLTVGLGATVNITGERIAGESIIEIYRDGTLLNSADPPETNLSTFNSAGTFNITVQHPSTTNYSFSSKTLYVTVQDTTAPAYETLTESPTDPATYVSGQRYEFNATWTDNASIDTVVIDFDGVNYTGISNVSSVYNISFLNLAAGTYNYRWYANDSSNNANDTGVQTYTVAQANDTVELYLNNTQDNLTITYGTQTNASAYSTSETHTLHRDGIAITNPQVATLAAGTYVYKANSTGNTNYTSNTTGETYTLTINQATSEVNLTLDGISANLTVGLGATVNITGERIAGEDIIQIYRNGILMNSGNSPQTNLSTFNSVGDINITIQYPSTTNYSFSSKTLYVTVQDTTAPTYANLTESPADSPIYSANTRYEFNVTWTDNASIDTVVLDFDGTNYTDITNVSAIYNRSFVDLAAGTYNYRWYANDSNGNTNDTGIQTYTIIQANDTVQLYLNNTQNNLTVTYGTQTNASAYSTTGTHTLHRDGIAITNPQVATLAAGTYVYKANSTGNTNYTSNTTGETYTLTVNQAASEVNLTFNGVSANLTVDLGTTVNITGERLTGESVIEIYRDGTLLNSGNSPQTNLSMFNSLGDINITIQYPSTTNYSFSSKTLYVTVQDTTAPTYANLTESPADSPTYITGARYEFNVTWTDNASIDTAVLDFDGTNYTDITNVSAIYNRSFVDLAAGTYNYRWYANDSSGNANDTGVQTYTIIQANDTVQLYLNNTQNNLTVTFGTETNASAYSTTGTHTLHRDGIAITNPQVATLAAGTYVYKANSTGNTNYTSNTTGETYTLTVNQAASEVNLTLNGTSANFTINLDTTVNITGLLVMPTTGTVLVYEDGSLIINGSSPRSTLRSYASASLVNITVIYESTTNYTRSAKTLYINATDQDPPTYSNIAEPTDPTTYTLIGSYQFNITWGDDINISNVFLEFDGTNYSLGAGEINNSGSVYYKKFSSLAGGTYNYKWYANDTTNNQNDTGTQTFTVDQAITALSMTFNPVSPVVYSTDVNASCAANNPESSPSITRDLVSVSNSEIIILGVGSYSYACTSTATANYTSGSDTETLTITQTATNVTLLLNGNEGNISINYSTESNVTASTNNLTLILYRDSVNVTNPEITTLAGGAYNYTVQNAGNTNFSASTQTYFLTVNKSASVINLTLNGTDSNVTLLENGTVEINLTLITPASGTITLYQNNSQLANGSNTLNYTATYNATGTFNLTGVYEGNINRSAATDTLFVIVESTTEDTTPGGSGSGGGGGAGGGGGGGGLSLSRSCLENWTCSDWSSCSAGSQERTCEDLNACGTNTFIPQTKKACGSSCVENWICTDWGPCENNLQIRICRDSNLCETDQNQPLEIQSCQPPEQGGFTDLLGGAAILPVTIPHPEYLLPTILLLIVLAVLLSIRKKKGAYLSKRMRLIFVILHLMLIGLILLFLLSDFVTVDIPISIGSSIPISGINGTTVALVIVVAMGFTVFAYTFYNKWKTPKNSKVTRKIKKKKSRKKVHKKLEKRKKKAKKRKTYNKKTMGKI